MGANREWPVILLSRAAMARLGRTLRLTLARHVRYAEVHSPRKIIRLSGEPHVVLSCARQGEPKSRRLIPMRRRHARLAQDIAKRLAFLFRIPKPIHPQFKIGRHKPDRQCLIHIPHLESGDARGDMREDGCILLAQKAKNTRAETNKLRVGSNSSLGVKIP